ncbi:hypothetical protein VNO77_30974 [Canavalia gladiata]|uniref:RNA helicase n=1 Tax=Canavalia gladiata TaxID=3824 RepID=A0AAN9KRK7_CANGL
MNKTDRCKTIHSSTGVAEDVSEWKLMSSPFVFGDFGSSKEFSKSSNGKYLYQEENRSMLVTLRASRDAIIHNGEKKCYNQDSKVLDKIKKFPKSIYNESWDGNAENSINVMHIRSVIVDPNGYKFEILEKDSTPQFFTLYDEVYNSFDAMDLQENLLRNIYTYCFERPSTIQLNGIVPFCKRLDMIKHAKSEIGKTATFFSGILQQLEFGLVHYQALVLELNVHIRDLDFLYVSLRVTSQVIYFLRKTNGLWEAY